MLLKAAARAPDVETRIERAREVLQGTGESHPKFADRVVALVRLDDERKHPRLRAH